MTSRVLEVPNAERAKLDAMLAEDPLSRQSITVKDAKGVGVNRASVMVILEGDERVLADAFAKAKTFGAVEPAEAKHILAVHQEESDAAASGMGAIFG
ncbi:MAG: hypothetical protein ACYDDF_00565 [Thermoplasmatota archaeon]